MTASPAPALMWFRQDLRLDDHPALAAAAEGRPVIAVYVLDEAGPWAHGGAHLWWLHHSLAALAKALDAKGLALTLRRGDSATEILRLVKETGAEAVHATLPVEPAARRLMHGLDKPLEKAGAPLHLHPGFTLFPPDAIRSKAGGVYGVYTAFARACRELGPHQTPSIPRKMTAGHAPRSDRLDDWGLLPTKPDWAGGLRAAWTPGEAGAKKRLKTFLKDRAGDYKRGRDVPGEDHTSGLSPHLHWGEISPARIWQEAEELDDPTFRNELLWREFSCYLLWHTPHLPDQPLRPQFANMPWRTDRKGLRAWQQGRTGLPIVDAGMRQLWQTGWMHNRVRMIVASYLIKHMMIPWQDGEAWFWDTLVDGDLAANAQNWQWVAGCGADAAPYFRIFNPVLQGRKFDAAGAYVRRYVPELAKLPDKHVHAPWEAPEDVLARAGITLGKTYPRPVVDLGEGRARALAAFRQIGGRNEGDEAA